MNTTTYRNADAAAVAIERTLGLPDETIWTDGKGVILTVEQVAALLALIPNGGQ